jgi:hypothetical protein
MLPHPSLDVSLGPYGDDRFASLPDESERLDEHLSDFAGLDRGIRL